MDKIQVFVYGTLRKGGIYNYLLEVNGAEFMGEDYVDGFQLVDVGRYPVAIPTKNGEERIYGEVYKIDEETLKILDRLEGYPHHYQRKEINVIWGRGSAWIYYQIWMKGHFFDILDQFKYKLIESGDWMEYKKDRENVENLV